MMSAAAHPSSRSAAKASGRLNYLTGKPCAHGHTALRFSSTGQCVECMRLRKLLPEIKADDAAYYKANRQHRIDAAAAYARANPEAVRANLRRWKKRNPAKVAAEQAMSRAGAACPPWARDHRDEILKFYLDAERLTKATGTLHHVDHIHALNGDGFCGLHVHWNLQVLTAGDNIRKGNALPLEATAS